MKHPGPPLVDHVPEASEEALRRELERLRHRGFRGGWIVQHRGLLVSPIHPGKQAAAWLLVILVLLAWYLAQPAVVAFWTGAMDFWQQGLGLGGYVTVLHYRLLDMIPLAVPYLGVSAGLPGPWAWWLGLITMLALFVASFFMPSRWVPFAYLLRIVCGFQATAQVFFGLWPRAFPYTASGYVHGMLIASLFFVTLVPIMLGFTYYIFDFTLRQKLTLTLIVMGHVIVMTPLQYVAHAWIIHHGSLLFLPVVFFVSGLPLDVLVFIALYAWGFSWPSRLRDEDTQALARQRNV